MTNPDHLYEEDVVTHPMREQGGDAWGPLAAPEQRVKRGDDDPNIRPAGVEAEHHEVATSLDKERAEVGAVGPDEVIEGEMPGRVGHEVNQSLARLEMNSLEVKLHLDSIDQRISRMEPRLEGICVHETSPEPIVAATEEERQTVTERTTPLEAPAEVFGTPQQMPTSERRRRAQGVPVERRRRAPHAVPVEIENEEMWDWRAWVAEQRTKVRGFRSKRAWWPVAVMALAVIVGLVYWGSAQRSRPKAGAGPVDAGAVIADAEPTTAERRAGNVGGRTRGEALGSRTQGDAKGRTDRGGAPAVIEQGVVASPAAAAAVGARVPSPMGGAANSNTGANGDVQSPTLAATTGATGATGTAGVAGTTGPAVATGGSPAPVGSGLGGAEAPAKAAEAGGGANADADPVPTPAPAPTRAPSAPSSRNLPLAARRINVSSGVMAGNLVYSNQPAYPHGIAGLFHSEGKVVLQAIVSRTGQVENLRVISGHYMLRGAAKDAVRTWRYRPYFINGKPVEVATIISVEFHR